jgi:hypothetical protein
MVNYQNGKIYRIVCNETGKQYIGSTTSSLALRLCQHKKLFKDGKSGTSKEVLQNGNYSIVLIQDCPCDRKEQLLQQERYYIETLDCVNKKIPLRTQHEWYEDNKEQYIARQMVWNNNNKDKLKEYQKTFRAKQQSDMVLKNRGVILDGEVDVDTGEIKLNIEDIYDCDCEAIEYDETLGALGDITEQYKDMIGELVERNIIIKNI